MAGNPTNQTFLVSMTTTLPASFISANDAINFMNSAGSGFWNGVVAGVVTLDRFVGLDVSNANISNARWANNNGHAQLAYNLNTTSDPITADQVSGALSALWDLILVAIGAALILIPVGGWALDLVGLIVAFSGGLGLLSTGVTQTGTAITSNPVLLIGAVVAIGALGFGLYSYISNEKFRRDINKTGSRVAHLAAGS